MKVTTVEDSFEYQCKTILKEMKQECPDGNFEDYIWNNRKELGELFFTRIDEYFGLTNLIEEI